MVYKGYINPPAIPKWELAVGIYGPGTPDPSPTTEMLLALAKRESEEIVHCTDGSAGQAAWYEGGDVVILGDYLPDFAYLLGGFLEGDPFDFPGGDEFRVNATALMLHLTVLGT